MMLLASLSPDIVEVSLGNHRGINDIKSLISTWQFVFFYSFLWPMRTCSWKYSNAYGGTFCEYITYVTMKRFDILSTREIARYVINICYYKIFNTNVYFAKLFEQLQLRAYLLLFYLFYEYIIYMLHETLTL